MIVSTGLSTGLSEQTFSKKDHSTSIWLVVNALNVFVSVYILRRGREREREDIDICLNVKLVDYFKNIF